MRRRRLPIGTRTFREIREEGARRTAVEMSPRRCS